MELTLEEIIEYLNVEQIGVDVVKKMLPPSIQSYFDTDYSYVVPPSKDDTFLSSLLYLLDPSFVEKDIVPLRQKMSKDIDAQKLFKQFNYQKDRTMKKGNIQKILLSLNVDSDKAIKKFIVDYFSINLIVFEDEKIHSFLSTDDSLESNPFKPTYFMYYTDGVYHAIVNNSDTQYHLFPESKILEGILKSMESKIEPSTSIKLSENMQLSQLQTVALELGVDIKKTSDRTKKVIRKRKQELYEECKARLEELKSSVITS